MLPAFYVTQAILSPEMAKIYAAGRAYQMKDAFACMWWLLLFLREMQHDRAPFIQHYVF